MPRGGTTSRCSARWRRRSAPRATASTSTSTSGSREAPETAWRSSRAGGRARACTCGSSSTRWAAPASMSSSTALSVRRAARCAISGRSRSAPSPSRGETIASSWSSMAAWASPGDSGSRPSGASARLLRLGGGTRTPRSRGRSCGRCRWRSRTTGSRREAGCCPAEEFERTRPAGDARAAYVTSTDVTGLSHARWVTHVALAAAQRRAWIANAYFVPPPEVVGTLCARQEERDRRAAAPVRSIPGPSHRDLRAAAALPAARAKRRGGVRVPALDDAREDDAHRRPPHRWSAP